jgi:hypothetical protein
MGPINVLYKKIVEKKRINELNKRETKKRRLEGSLKRSFFQKSKAIKELKFSTNSRIKKQAQYRFDKVSRLIGNLFKIQREIKEREIAEERKKLALFLFAIEKKRERFLFLKKYEEDRKIIYSLLIIFSKNLPVVLSSVGKVKAK